MSATIGTCKARLALLVCVLSVFLPTPRAAAQFGCLFSVPTPVRDQIADYDEVLVARLEGEPPSDGDEMIRVAVQRVLRGKFAGRWIRLESQFLRGDTGECVLLLGNYEEGRLQFASGIRGSSELMDYVESLPPRDADPAKVLEFFLDQVFHKNKEISFDARVELARIPFPQFRRHRELIPQEPLRIRLEDYARAEEPDREFDDRQSVALNVLLLAAVGDSRDEELFRRLTFEENFENAVRLGIEDIMFAYLFLAGEGGLRQLQCEYVHSDGARFSDTFAVLSALRKVRHDGENRIPEPVLKDAFRRFLDRPELVDLALRDLSEIRDWSCMGRVVHMYNDPAQEPESMRPMRRAIVRYLLAAAGDSPQGDSGPVPAHVVQARKYLAFLREVDPATVKKAEMLHNIAGPTSD